MKSELSFEQTSEYLAGFRGTGKKILVSAHVRPDGDALGSTCGLVTLLRENGFEAYGVEPPGMPDYFREFLMGEDLFAPCPEVEALKEYSLFISLDSARKDRSYAGFFSGEATEFPFPVLNIDHHVDNPAYGDYNLVVPSAAATAEIVANLALCSHWKMGEKAATFLLIGLLTDTGGLRFRNTSPAALRSAASLEEAGGAFDRVVNACFFSKSENMARFEADLLCNHLQKAFDGRFLYTYYAPELLTRYGIELRNTEQVIEILRSISGPLIVATLYKEADFFKCSLRSKDPRYSVGRVARAIGGGGHELAAGCTIRVSTMEDALAIVLKYVEKELNEKPT